MKILPAIFVALLVAGACHAQPGPPPLLPASPAPGQPARTKDTGNYLIRVEWKDAKKEIKSLELLTTEGQISYDGLQKNSVKINDNEVPVTLKLTGTLHVLDEEKGRLDLYLGRTVPYVTSSYGSGSSRSSSYSQMSVGLQSAFIVTFGKPVVIQNDDNGTITVLVKRMTD